MTNQQYFYLFLRHKINSGVKQVDLVRSKFINVSQSYINKLYLNPPKKCDIAIQRSIARHFGLSYDEMIAEAKKLHKEQEKSDQAPHGFTPEQKSTKTDDEASHNLHIPPSLIKQLNFVAEGIRNNHNYTTKVETQRDEMLSLFNNLKTGLCVVDSELNVLFQNPAHKKFFGDKVDKRYALFWDQSLNKKSLFRKLTTGEYETVKAEHEDKQLLVHLMLMYKGSRVDKIVEHVIDYQDQENLHLSTARQISIYKQMLNKLGHEFIFFNRQREMEFASNWLGLHEKYDFPNHRPSVDQLLLDLGEKMGDAMQEMATLKRAYENEEEIEIDIKIHETAYNLQSLNISKDGKNIGMLLIAKKHTGNT